MDEFLVRTCPVCGREYVFDRRLLRPETCNAKHCQIQGHVDITIPSQDLIIINNWKILWYPNLTPNKGYLLTRVQSVRFTRDSPIVVITEEYDSSGGDVHGGVWSTRERAFIYSRIRIE